LDCRLRIGGDRDLRHTTMTRDRIRQAFRLSRFDFDTSDVDQGTR